MVADDTRSFITGFEVYCPIPTLIVIFFIFIIPYYDNFFYTFLYFPTIYFKGLDM